MHRARDAGTALLFLAPSLVLFGLFTFWPLIRTFGLSFYGSDIIGRPTLFVGTRQYEQLLSSPALRDTLVVTVLFALMTVLPSIVLGLALALLLQARLAAIGVFRTLLATPFAFSVATASVIFAIFYNPGVGVFNGFLQVLHLPPVGWLTNPSTALPSVAAASVWLQLGYNVLVLSAGLQAIPEEVYEAARLDGARGFSQLRSVTLPLLTPSLFFLLVVTTIVSLQSFGQIHILTRGGPANATTTPQFRTAIDQLHATKLDKATQGCLLGVMPAARQATEVGIQNAILGKATPQKAMDDAAASMQSQIDQYNQAVAATK